MPMYEVYFQGSVYIEAEDEDQAKWMVDQMCDWPEDPSFDVYLQDSGQKPS